MPSKGGVWNSKPIVDGSTMRTKTWLHFSAAASTTKLKVSALEPRFCIFNYTNHEMPKNHFIFEITVGLLLGNKPYQIG
jgi:hypothetical protein